jgi:putative oxidoreductase
MDRQALGLLVLRLTAGLALALNHGLGKLPPSDGFIQGVGSMGFPLPLLFAWAAALSESLGGLLLAAGLFARPAAAAILGTMTTAILIAHAGDPLAKREPALIYAAIALLVLLAGPGRYALDTLLAKRRG